MMSEDMRGLFFIVKGQYRRGVEPSFKNSVSGDVSFIGGYDPFRDDTENWYMLMDKNSFNCISCGQDLNKVLKAVHTIIVKHKGSAKSYYKYLSATTTDDYYEVHYLGKAPLTHDQRVKKAEGRCPRVSPVMRELYRNIYEEFGDYYEDEIGEMEDLAYSELVEKRKESKPINKAKKRLAKVKPQKPVMETQKQVMASTKMTMVKPKLKLGVKKLAMAHSEDKFIV